MGDSRHPLQAPDNDFASAPLASAVVSPEFHDARLDAALTLLFPEHDRMGPRQLRRLWERFQVLVDGRLRPKGFHVQAGQTLSLRALPERAVDTAPFSLSAPVLPRIVAETAHYAALDKPAGLHSQRLAGRDTPSAEALLPRLWSDRPARLCIRLDRDTTGLLLVAFSDAALAAFRDLEDQGRVDKRYLAVVHGRIPGPLLADQALDTARRAVTRVLPQPSPDPLRHTAVEPLAHAADLTLVRCRIRKGARHQIRAHLAALGHPILGDPLYGLDTPPDRGADALGSPRTPHDAGLLRLHHHALAFPGFAASCLPPWPDMAALLRAAAIEPPPDADDGPALSLDAELGYHRIQRLK